MAVTQTACTFAIFVAFVNLVTGCHNGNSEEYAADARCFYTVNALTGVKILTPCPTGTLFDKDGCLCVFPRDGMMHGTSQECDSVHHGGVVHTDIGTGTGPGVGSGSRTTPSGGHVHSWHHACYSRHSYYKEIYDSVKNGHCNSVYHYAEKISVIAHSDSYGFSTMCLHSLIDSLHGRFGHDCRCSSDYIHMRYRQVQNSVYRTCWPHSPYHDVVTSTLTEVTHHMQETSSPIQCMTLNTLLNKLHAFKFSYGYEDNCLIDYLRHLGEAAKYQRDPCHCSSGLITFSRHTTPTSLPPTTQVPTTTLAPIVNCVDMTDCSHYGPSLCGHFSDYARMACPAYCGLCVPNSTAATTTTQPTTTRNPITTTTVGVCLDLIDCSQKGPTVCGHEPALAHVACMAYCGFCTGPSTTKTTTTTTTAASTARPSSVYMPISTQAPTNKPSTVNSPITTKAPNQWLTIHRR